MILEGCKAGNDPTLDAKRRHLVRNDLFRLRDDLEDRAPQSFKRAALGLLDPAKIFVDVFDRHSLIPLPSVRALLGRMMFSAGRYASFSLTLNRRSRDPPRGEEEVNLRLAVAPPTRLMARKAWTRALVTLKTA